MNYIENFTNLSAFEKELLKDDMCPGVYVSTWQLVENVKKYVSLNTKRSVLDARFPYLKAQDISHESMGKKIIEWIRPVIGGIDLFDKFYPTNGSSEGFKEIINNFGNKCFKKTGKELEEQLQMMIKKPNYQRTMYLLKGEYEGYYHYATGANIPTKYFSKENYKEELKTIDKGSLVIISEPSAIDGNYWEGLQRFLKFAEEKDLEVWIDIAYHGTTTRLKKTDLSMSCVKGIFFSFSKSFGGCFYDRIGGVLAKEPIPNLIAHALWFKDLNNIELASQLLHQFPVQEKRLIYEDTQKEVIKKLNDKYKFQGKEKIVASDVFLLGHRPHVAGKFEQLNRGGTQRFVFSPYMDKVINEFSIDEIVDTYKYQIKKWRT